MIVNSSLRKIFEVKKVSSCHYLSSILCCIMICVYNSMIYFIRHAESTYNDKIKQLKKVYGDQYKNSEKYFDYKFNPDFIDAGITPFGVNQCQELI